MSTADKLNALVQTKADIKQALIDKGQNPSDVFSTYADDIRAIETSGGGRDWSALGYEEEPTNIIKGFEYALYLKEASDNRINIRNDLQRNPNLVYLPSNLNWDNIGIAYSGWTSTQLLANNKNLLYVDILDLSRTYNITTTTYYHPTDSLFYECGSLQYVNKLCVCDNFEMTNTNNSFQFSKAFYNCKSLKRIGEIVGKVSSLNQSFYGCESLEELPSIDVSKVTDFTNTFNGCKSLKTLDLKTWDTSKATTMSGIFRECVSLETLDISTWDLSNIERLDYFIHNCNKLKNLYLPENIEKKDMSNFFYGCYSLPDELFNNLDWTKVESVNQTFGGMKNRESIDLSGIVTNTFTDMGYMFSGSSMKYINIPNIDSSNCNNFRRIFDSNTLIAVNGVLDFIKFNDSYYATQDVLFGYNTPVIRCITIKNLGAQQNLSNINYFKQCSKWGIPDENIEYTANGRTTLHNTMVNLYDRVEAGYSVCTLSLHNDTKALLTENEIAQITAKGFTIA